MLVPLLCRSSVAVAAGTLPPPPLILTVEVSGLSGKINVRHRQNEITELTMEALGGRIDGSVTHRSHPDRLSIGLQCRDLDISKVSTTYDFSTVVPGSLTASVAAEASRDKLICITPGQCADSGTWS